MTNQELNLAIAQLVYPDAWYQDGCMVNGVVVIQLPDYCNNWNDLMPLVIEYGISLSDNYQDGLFAATKWHYLGDATTFTSARDKDPQIALAECLLLVLQEKEKAE